MPQLNVLPVPTSLIISSKLKWISVKDFFNFQFVGVEPRNFSYIHYNFRNHHLINGSLLIRELEEADQGYYLCEAHNGIGAGISKLVYLTVHVPPHFDTKHRSYNVAKVRTH